MRLGTRGKGERWWELKDYDELARAICSGIRAIEDDPEEQARLRDYDRFRARYDTCLNLKASSRNSPLQQALSNVGPQVVNFNVCQVVADVATTQLCGGRTSVMALTREGDFNLQRQAKLLNFFLDGQFREAGQYAKTPQMVTDAAVTGTGIIKICEDVITRPGRILSKVVDACDLVVPVLEGRTSHPTFLYEIERVPKDALEQLYPRGTEAIEHAAPIRDYDREAEMVHLDGPDEVCWVAHAYKLPVGKQEGRYVVCTSAGVLSDEEWDEGTFPYAIMRWKPRKKCFWGISMLQDIDSVQEELDHLCWKIQDHMKRACTQVWTRKGSAVTPQASRTNLAFSHHEFFNEPPIILNIPPIEASYFGERQQLFNKAYELTGVTPMTATGETPAGIKSGKALRMLKDIAAGRLKLQGDSLDDAQVEAAAKMIALAKRIDERGDGDYRIMAKGKKGLLTLRWSDVALEDTQYQLQMFPTSFLSQTPSSRIDEATELLQAMPQLQPFIPKVLNFPDVEELTSLASAGIDEVLTCLESIEDGVYMGPDPHTDVAAAVPMALSYYRKVRANEGDPYVLQMLRDYMDACQEIMSLANAAAAPMPAPPMGPPGEAMPPEMAGMPPMPPGMPPPEMGMPPPVGM